MSKQVTVAVIPPCDFHRTAIVPSTVPAVVDGKTTLGPWANMCQAHFEQYGTGLGTGKGQRLVLFYSEQRAAEARETLYPTANTHGVDAGDHSAVEVNP